MSGPTQQVYFLPPAQITNLANNVAALQNQTSGTGSINTTGNVTASNVYGTNFNLTSLLTGFASNIIGIQDKFQLTVDAFGNLKIIPVLTLPSSAYKATASVNIDGQWTVTGDDIQSCFYMYQLMATLIDPTEVANRRAICCGKMYSVADCLGAAYYKMKIMELEVAGQVPPVLLSFAKAIQQANNDAKELVQPQFQSSFVDMTIIDGLCCLLWSTNVGMLDGTFDINSNMLTPYWIQYVLYQNNLGPKPTMSNPLSLPPLGQGELNQNVGIPDKNSRTASAFLKVGSAYVKEGKGVALGSSHWYNIGFFEMNIVKMVVPSQNIDFILTHLKTIPLLPNFNSSSLLANSNSNGNADSLYIPYVNLANPTGTSYMIGNSEYPIEFEGPITLNWTPEVSTIIDNVFGYSYSTSQTGPLKLNIPCTKYGPIAAWDEPNNRVYSYPLKITSNYLTEMSKLFTEMIFFTSAEQYMEFVRQYGGAKYDIDMSILDNSGNIFCYNQGSHLLLGYQKIYDNAANSLYNPLSANDVSFANTSNNSQFWYNIVNGSDPDVYTSLCFPANNWGQDNLGNVQGDIIIDTGIVNTMVQHSNTEVNDFTPGFEYNINHASVDILFNPRQLLELSGVNLISGQTGALEATRLANTGTYNEMMNQVSVYRPLVNKADSIYHCLYNNMGLISYNSSGAISLTTGALSEWKTPSDAHKLTMTGAMNLQFDRTAYRMKPNQPQIAEFLESWFASNGPDWTSEYLNTIISPEISNGQSIKFISAAQATGAITQAVLQDAVNVYKNWDCTFNINSTGAHLAYQMWFRVYNRYYGSINEQLVAQQFTNSLTSTLAGEGSYYVDYWLIWADQFLNSIAPEESTYKWWYAVPNFTGPLDGSDVWTKTRELTQDDRWNIFLNRLQYPYGFDPNKPASYIIDPTLGTGCFAPPSTNGQLFQESFIAAVLDIYQLYDTIDVSYVDPYLSLNTVTYAAPTDTPANNIAFKLRLPWGAMHTNIYPYDWSDPYDPTSNFVQYAMPYGQDNWVGGSLTQISKRSLLSTEAGDFIGALVGQDLDPFNPSLNFPTITSLYPYWGAASLQYGGQLNCLSGSNQIFTYIQGATNGPILYRSGYVGNAGGSSFMSQDSVNSSGVNTVRTVNQIGVVPTNSYTYRMSVFNIQNDIIPEFGSNPPLYSITGPASYDRTDMSTNLAFKPAGDGITW